MNDAKFWSLVTAIHEHFEHHDISGSGDIQSDDEQMQPNTSYNNKVLLLHVHLDLCFIFPFHAASWWLLQCETDTARSRTTKRYALFPFHATLWRSLRCWCETDAAQSRAKSRYVICPRAPFLNVVHRSSSSSGFACGLIRYPLVRCQNIKLSRIWGGKRYSTCVDHFKISSSDAWNRQMMLAIIVASVQKYKNHFAMFVFLISQPWKCRNDVEFF